MCRCCGLIVPRRERKLRFNGVLLPTGQFMSSIVELCGAILGRNQDRFSCWIDGKVSRFAMRPHWELDKPHVVDCSAPWTQHGGMSRPMSWRSSLASMPGNRWARSIGRERLCRVKMSFFALGNFRAPPETCSALIAVRPERMKLGSEMHETAWAIEHL